MKKVSGLLLLICLVACGAKNPDALSPPQTPVGVVHLQFFDAARKRPQRVTLWYPALGIEPDRRRDYAHFFIGYAAEAATYDAVLAQRPLLLLSHGDKGNAINLSWLAEVFAAHGYIVVAVDHWLNTHDNFTPEQTAKVWDRPADLSFVLTQLLQDRTWGARIDADRIGAAGHSSGGYTALALAGAAFRSGLMADYCASARRGFDCTLSAGADFNAIDYRREKNDTRDARIKAVFAMAPAVGQGVAPDSLQAITVPVSIVTTEDDQVLTPELNAARYAALIPHASLRVIPAGGHFAFISECSAFGKIIGRFLTFDICGLRADGDRGQIHAQLAADALRFFQRAM